MNRMNEAANLQEKELYRSLGTLAALVEKGAEALQLWIELDILTEAATAALVSGSVPSNEDFDRLQAVRVKALHAYPRVYSRRETVTPEERESWLADTARGSTSSDGPKIVLGSAYLVYLDKTGQLQDVDSEPKRWGRLLEDTVAQAYAEEEGRTIRLPPTPIMWSPTTPWMFASVDRLAVKPDGKEIICECKTTGFASDEWGETGTDQVPDAVNIQVQHQFAATGYDEKPRFPSWSAEARSLRVYVVHRSDPIIEKLLYIEEDFVRRVQERDPPPINWDNPATVEVLKGLYGVVGGLSIELDDAAAQLVQEFLACKEEGKEEERQEKRMRSQLEHLMEGADNASLPNGVKLLHSRSSPKTTWYPGASTLRLTIKTQVRNHMAKQDEQNTIGCLQEVVLNDRLSAEAAEGDWQCPA